MELLCPGTFTEAESRKNGHTRNGVQHDHGTQAYLLAFQDYFI
jgi:hypothetical protein